MFGYPGGDLTVPIDATLGPGHYWLSVQGDGTNYFWWIRKPIANDPAQWRDPTDFFGLGCPAWTDMATCFSYTGDGAPGTLDLMFSVSGTSSTDKQVGAASVCNGSYNGFGTNVVVPAGATCTILPGGGVAYDLKVMKGGTLNTDGATIGHDLTVDGSATVCDSEVGHDLTEAGGPVTIGGADLHRQRRSAKTSACRTSRVERPSRPTPSSQPQRPQRPGWRGRHRQQRRPGHERRSTTDRRPRSATTASAPMPSARTTADKPARATPLATTTAAPRRAPPEDKDIEGRETGPRLHEKEASPSGALNPATEAVRCRLGLINLSWRGR